MKQKKKVVLISLVVATMVSYFLILELKSIQNLRKLFKPKIGLNDVCITIKTSKKFYESRLELILKTWFKTAEGQVFIITDESDEIYQNKTGNKLVTSKCGSSHGLYDLCCKVGLSYDTFMSDQNKKWWCYFDDDNYVHVDRLLEFLSQFDYKDHIYISKRSRPTFQSKYKARMYEYQFGTGGAGVCITRPLAQRMKPWIGIQALPLMCQEVGAADDCVVGFVITALLGVNLTESMFFHSHFEKFTNFLTETLNEQITFSYDAKNVLNLTGIDDAFHEKEDPTRIMSLHCHLYPHDELCKKK